MIFIRITFLLLVLTSVNIYAQNPSQIIEKANKKQAYKFYEYGEITDSKLHERLGRLVLDITEINAVGLIINYAPTNKKIELREGKIRKNMGRSWCHWDSCQIEFVNNKSNRERTEIWIVPKGIELLLSKSKK
jgi:hypothetical protein